MKPHKGILRSRRNTSQLVALVLIAIFLIASRGAINQSSAIQKSEGDLIDQANKAVANAETVLRFADAKKLEGEQRLAELQEFVKFKEPDLNTVSSLQRLTDTVNSMFDATEQKSLLTQLDDAQAELVDAYKKLNGSKTALDSATSTDKIETAKKTVKDSIDKIKTRLDETGETAPDWSGLKTKLKNTLKAGYDGVKNVVKIAEDRLQPFKQNDIAPANLFAISQNKLADIPGLIQFDFDFQNKWTDLFPELKKLAVEDPANADAVDNAVKNLHGSIQTVVNNLNAQVAILAGYAKNRDEGVFNTASNFRSDPQAHEREALDSISESERVAAALEKMTRAVDAISNQAEAAGTQGFDKAKTQAAQRDLTDKVSHLRLTAASLQELLSGDRTLWITEKIRLYYFTDIPRLVRTLNPAATLAGGDADARRRAEDRLDRLRAAEDAQSEANGRVAGLKRQVADLRQQLAVAKDELDAANDMARITASRDAELNRRPAGDVSAERKARSAEEKDRREQQRVAAQQRSDKLNDEHDGLVAQLAKAETDLETAQAAFERASNATIRAAQAESAAFANARDNAPFWFAPAIAASTDPAKRVEITSSTGGENAIFVRGRREDIVKVQDIVAELDEPAPQARMTLWKIELNSDATKKGAEKFNKSLEIVEQELASTRARIAAALSLLLESIGEEAELAASQKVLDPDNRKDCEERELYTKYGFPLDPALTDISGRTQRLRRYALYSEQVQKELGVEFINELGFDNPKQFGLKDPASATTLNEALIVLLLTDRDHRRRIMTRFESRLDARLGAVTSVVQSKPTDKKNLIPLPKHFARLDSMLNVDSPATTPVNTEMTRQQEELVYAIRGLLLKHLVGRIIKLQSRIDGFVKLHDKGLARRTTEETALYECLQRKLPRIFDTIHDEFPISAIEALSGRVKLVPSSDGTIALQPFDEVRRPLGPPLVYNLRPSPARVAAADGMLDVFTKAFEDDIDREYVQPMLRDLRVKLKSKGIGFGVIQRTSVLATNRLVARVDPRATAELAVGEETNLIQGLQQISQLTLAAQTGGVSGVLGVFKSQANDARPPEIYGITSGSAFQVTPIFDPTGQALRFKFDFVDTTLVREPKGTTNPRLPRVERHTVNTEVQLANLEIREVSRFESDSKIGLPTTYKGGLPLLKDLPGIRPVPFIGWFVRRKGSNAIAQRSLIFAQTTMSPTIGDILDLLDTSLQRR